MLVLTEDMKRVIRSEKGERKVENASQTKRNSDIYYTPRVLGEILTNMILLLGFHKSDYTQLQNLIFHSLLRYFFLCQSQRRLEEHILTSSNLQSSYMCALGL